MNEKQPIKSSIHRMDVHCEDPELKYKSPLQRQQQQSVYLSHNQNHFVQQRQVQKRNYTGTDSLSDPRLSRHSLNARSLTDSRFSQDHHGSEDSTISNQRHHSYLDNNFGKLNVINSSSFNKRYMENNSINEESFGSHRQHTDNDLIDSNQPSSSKNHFNTKGFSENSRCNGGDRSESSGLTNNVNNYNNIEKYNYRRYNDSNNRFNKNGRDYDNNERFDRNDRFNKNDRNFNQQNRNDRFGNTVKGNNRFNDYNNSRRDCRDDSLYQRNNGKCLKLKITKKKIIL